MPCPYFHKKRLGAGRLAIMPEGWQVSRVSGRTLLSVLVLSLRAKCIHGFGLTTGVAEFVDGETAGLETLVVVVGGGFVNGTAPEPAPA